MQNHLKNQTSPYLLQHADNSVEWYPWCEEAFKRAKAEDKPVFLSIGYSTCHWCHVMAHESFEDSEIAEILNHYFISIKVDKEERPDIDSIYMSVCQAYTGSGGWPTTIFMTPDQKPFFTGTYFPKNAKYGRPGLKEILWSISRKWQSDRATLIKSAEDIILFLDKKQITKGDVDEQLVDRGFTLYQRMYDEEFGGFGEAPKFPTPHNLLFLMRYYEKSQDKEALEMVEKTLLQMYRGGMSDHIGGGFSRYSTDRYFLAPHFEKMLYDNALLILAYSKAYQLTQNPIYCKVAEKTAAYVLREMTDKEGGFYSAQDADSEGVEGKYYLFEPSEIVEILGEETGEQFNAYFDITEKGNFEGKSIPNLLKSDDLDEDFENEIQTLYEYRKNRYALHLDDKILTSWNALMIAAMCNLYRVTQKKMYLEAALKAQSFIQSKLCDNHTLHISYREGKRSGKGFLEDYAYEVFALIALYGATLEKEYLENAKEFCKKAIHDFWDEEQGGFFLYGEENERLILRPKETYDGAVFSGNSAMAYNLVQLELLMDDKEFEEIVERQLQFMSNEATHYPAGYAMFLVALSDYSDLSREVTVVLKDKNDREELPFKIPLDSIVRVLDGPTGEYALKNNKTTFYVCEGHTCKPPVNEFL